MERVEASLHDWPLATWDSKQDTDTNYKRVLDYALHPDRIAQRARSASPVTTCSTSRSPGCWPGSAASATASSSRCCSGMAQGQAEVVRREVGGLLLYTPVVHPSEFDVAIAYLVRRLEEGASHENFMSAVFDLHDDEALFERERDRFLASLAALDRAVPAPNRIQDRRAAGPPTPMTGLRQRRPTPTRRCRPTARGAGRSSTGCRRQHGRRRASSRRHRRPTPEQLDAVLAGAVERRRRLGRADRRRARRRACAGPRSRWSGAGPSCSR